MDVHDPLTATTDEASCATAGTDALDVHTSYAPGAGWSCLWFASRFGI